MEKLVGQRWLQPALVLLGVALMVLAMRISVPHEAQWEIWRSGSPSYPCERWATPCTAAQRAAGRLRGELVWWSGAAALALALATRLLAVTGHEMTMGMRRQRVLVAAASLFPAWWLGGLAGIWVGSLAPFTGVALAVLVLLWQGVVLLPGGPGQASPTGPAPRPTLAPSPLVARRFAVLAVLVLVSGLVVPWWNNLGDLADELGQDRRRPVVQVMWVGALLIPVAGALAANRLARRWTPDARVRPAG